MIRPAIGVDQAQILDEEVDWEDAGDPGDQLGKDEDAQKEGGAGKFVTRNHIGRRACQCRLPIARSRRKQTVN